MHTNIHSIIVYNSQDMETTYMSIDRRMAKENAVYIYNGVLIPLWKKRSFHLRQHGKI